ncbi:MAG: hypothetical protein KGI06_03235 [Candidatus Micrarchaeota archaeon]|nr:hypothetical protein [Candidatus Micrarchaeota archaeon]
MSLFGIDFSKDLSNEQVIATIKDAYFAWGYNTGKLVPDLLITVYEASKEHKGYAHYNLVFTPNFIYGEFLDSKQGKVNMKISYKKIKKIAVRREAGTGLSGDFSDPHILLELYLGLFNLMVFIIDDKNLENIVGILSKTPASNKLRDRLF